MLKFLGRLFDSNEKELTRIRPLVATINSFEEKIRKIKDSDFGQKTAEFKNVLADGKTLDDILPESFALVREAAQRTIGERHFDVQMIAAICLHRGAVAEQKTGEGKT